MKVTINIDEKKIANLLASGMEGGINYWARIAEYKKPANPFPFCDSNTGLAKEEWEIYPHVDYPLNEDGAVILKDLLLEVSDSKADCLLTLDKKAILKGLNIMADKYAHHFSNFMDDSGDATTGDVFIQCCLFGEIVYG